MGGMGWVRHVKVLNLYHTHTSIILTLEVVTYIIYSTPEVVTYIIYSTLEVVTYIIYSTLEVVSLLGFVSECMHICMCTCRHACVCY